MSKWTIGRFEVAGRDVARTALASAVLAPMSLTVRSHRQSRRWASAARRALAMVEDVQGLEHVDPSSQYVVTPLHEGFADALLLYHLPLNLRFVVRDELYRWKWLGPGLRRTNQVMMSPEDGTASLRRLITETKLSFENGESLVMFPQGTILGVEAGFRPAAFRLADMLGAHVLPVVITGTHRVWEHPFSNRLRYRQRVSMRILEPLPEGDARRRVDQLQVRMKEVALDCETAPARHFDPDRDGFWDGYSFEIDPAFPELARRVAEHRASTSSAVGGETQVNSTM